MPRTDLLPQAPLLSWPHEGLVAIVDLEYTAWEGSAQRLWSGPSEWREIVQIGLVIADAGDAFAVREEFEALVRPLRNPVLSDYFVALTGITQLRLEEEAVPLDAAVARLVSFARAAGPIICNGHDGQILRENCAFHGVPPPWPAERMLDFRPLLATTLGCPASTLTSSDLPRLAGVTVGGHHHSALHDCRAIAASLASWRAAGSL